MRREIMDVPSRAKNGAEACMMKLYKRNLFEGFVFQSEKYRRQLPDVQALLKSPSGSSYGETCIGITWAVQILLLGLNRKTGRR